MNLFRSRLAFLAAAASLLVTGPLAAQRAMAQGAPAVATKPASQQDVNVYSQMGAINVCVLNTSKIGFDKSLQASLEMIMPVLEGLHGGVIQGVNNGNKLSRDQLVNGMGAQILLRVQQMCGSKLSAADKKTLDGVVSQIRKNSPSQSGGK